MRVIQLRHFVCPTVLFVLFHEIKRYIYHKIPVIKIVLKQPKFKILFDGIMVLVCFILLFILGCIYFETKMLYFIYTLVDITCRSPFLQTDLYTVGGNSHAVCVRTEKFSEKPTYSIVKIDFRGKKPILKCSTCKWMVFQ